MQHLYGFRPICIGMQAIRSSTNIVRPISHSLRRRKKSARSTIGYLGEGADVAEKRYGAQRFLLETTVQLVQTKEFHTISSGIRISAKT